MNITFEDDRLPASFWERVHPEPMSGCWLWTGSYRGKGYPSFGGSGYGHRAMAEVAHGIPNGLVVDHLCSTPCCVNPDHLEPVTTKVNNQRGYRAGRATCPAGHQMSGGNLYVDPRGNRQCKACRCVARRKDYHAAKERNR